MRRITVRLKERSYDVIIGSGILKDCGRLLKRLEIGRDAVIVTNRNILNLYGRSVEKALKDAGFTVRFELVPDSEKAKSYRCAMRLIESISGYDRLKECFIIAFGGGVIGDLAGFVAAVYKRGIPYVQIPTTLLAQVDSAIGGKVAIDTPAAKNLVGAFHQPAIAISDTALTRSLSGREMRNGLAEIVKCGIIKDAKLFELLENKYDKILECDERTLEYVVTKSAQIKARLVEADEYDKKGIRVVLNYGHTIGHAIEAASKYSSLYNHGEAVAIGMVIAADISMAIGMIDSSDALRIEDLVKRLGLPTHVKAALFSDIYKAHLYDKKFIHGKNRLVLPLGIGRAKVVEDISDSIVRSAIKKHLS